MNIRRSRLSQVVFILALTRFAVAFLVIVFMLVSIRLGWALHSLHVNWWIVFVCFLLQSVFGLATAFPSGRQVNRRFVFVCLLADAVLWFFFLKETGGAMNPANSYFLVLLSLSALTLHLRQTLLLLILVMLLYTGMMFSDHHSLHSMMGWHLWGMWLMFLFTALILIATIHYLGDRLKQQQKSISAFKESTARSEQLVMMGTLAAGIVHELGTPLSTIAMTAESLEEQEGAAGPEQESAAAILQEVYRCRQILEQLKSLPDSDHDSEQQITDFLYRLKQDLLLIKPAANLTVEVKYNDVIRVPMLLRQALLSLSVNAIDASRHQVTLSLQLAGDTLLFDLFHDGEKIPEKMLDQLGVSFPVSGKGGLGVGYFLANASIERLGGSVSLYNREKDVLTRVAIPLTALKLKT